MLKRRFATSNTLLHANTLLTQPVSQPLTACFMLLHCTQQLLSARSIHFFFSRGCLGGRRRASGWRLRPVPSLVRWPRSPQPLGSPRRRARWLPGTRLHCAARRPQFHDLRMSMCHFNLLLCASPMCCYFRFSLLPSYGKTIDDVLLAPWPRQPLFQGTRVAEDAISLAIDRLGRTARASAVEEARAAVGSVARTRHRCGLKAICYREP